MLNLNVPAETGLAGIGESDLVKFIANDEDQSPRFYRGWPQALWSDVASREVFGNVTTARQSYGNVPVRAFAHDLGVSQSEFFGPSVFGQSA